MSSDINDENDNTYQDSGYLTIISSSYVTSPTRLSPSIVIYSQNDSPITSPINPLIQKFSSTIDYENYITTRKYFDILTQLSHRNTHHIIEKILKTFSQNDFLSCLIVCKKWNSIFNDYYHRKKTKNVKRNLFNDTKKLTSTPMQTLTNNISTKSPSIPFHIDNEENNINLTASTLTFRYGYLKHLHGPTVPKRCPICAFVSIVDTNDQHGICTNPLCRNSFCQCCSAPYHPSSPCKISTGPIRSPWRKRPSISPIYSNKTRNNLRRLLIN